MNTAPNKTKQVLVFLVWVLWIPIILFCSHLITLRNGSTFHLILTALLFLMILLAIRWLSKRLDNSSSTAKQTLIRIRKQFLYGFLIPITTFITLGLVYAKWVDVNAIQPVDLLKELSVVIMFLYLANSFYLVIHIDRQFSLATVKVEEIKHFHEKVLVYHKGSYVPINLMEIALIYQRGQINWLITFEEEEHILDLSLNEIQKILSAAHFFKINRNQIVHKEAIYNYNAGSYGKINIEMKIKKMSATVSKDRAKDFRKWFYK